MPKPRLKLSLTARRRRHAHRVLPSAQQDIRLPHRDRRAIQRRLRLVRLQHRQRARVVQTGRFVLAGGDEVRTVRRELEVGDDVHVRALVGEDFFARFGVEEGDFAGFVPREEEVGDM